jgi:DNA-directed RNA polymerase specialized sigma24 family protein
LTRFPSPRYEPKRQAAWPPNTRSPPVLRLVSGHTPEPPDALAGVARAAVAGDGSALRTLLLSVGPHILHVVRRILGANHPEIDDVAQESSIAVIDALGRHRGESTVFLAGRVAALTAMKARRRNAARKRQSIRDHQSVHPSCALVPSAC